MPPPAQGTLALVMSGGGARAAYQVGMLRVLARRFPDLSPPILTGVSAGAINAAYLAAREGSLADAVEELTRLWSTLSVDQVFEVRPGYLARNLARAAVKLVSGGAPTAPGPRAMVDTRPLRELLERLFDSRDGPLPGIDANLARGRLSAVAIVGSSYSTGQSIVWVQGQGTRGWERAHRKSDHVRLTTSHVMASAALPLFFPAVEVDGRWYGDGGIRLTAPLSPAVHLGAERILAITTRYRRSREEAAEPQVVAYPPVAQVAGALLNAIFLDLFDADALTLERVNRLIERLSPEDRGELRPIELLVVRPSRDLGKLANEYEPELPRAFRFLTRGLGTRETRSNDLLSLVMFQADYLAHLIRLGEADAEARSGEIERFLARPSEAPRGVGTG